MTPESADDILNERAQHLLRVLVESYIREGQPVGSRTLSRDSGLQPEFGHHPQRHGGPRGATASSPRRTPRPAACRPTRATGSSSIRCCGSGQPGPTDEVIDALRRRLDEERGPRCQGAGRGRLAGAVVDHAPGGRRDDAAAAAPVAEPDRVPAAVRQPRARGDGRQWPRRAEPHRAARAVLLGRRTAARRRLPQPAVRRQGAARRSAKTSSASSRRRGEQLNQLMRDAIMLAQQMVGVAAAGGVRVRDRRRNQSDGVRGAVERRQAAAAVRGVHRRSATSCTCSTRACAPRACRSSSARSPATGSWTTAAW